MSTTKSPPAPPQVRSALTSYDYILYIITVLSWSASWYALKLQVGTVPVQVSLLWRFIIAAAIMLLWALLAKVPMKFPLAMHLKFAGLGIFMFCLNFALFYYASAYLASGLLSVVFSLAAIFNIFLAMMFLGLRPTANMIIGAILGMIGIAMMFWPVIARQTFDANALFGLALCIIGTLFFCTGNLISTSLQKANIPIISASAWGMTYGAIASFIIAVAQGDQFIIDWNISYMGSLIFLALVSSVIAFAAYLTLLGRIGSDRAGYATVMFPVIALVISSYVENYQMNLLAGAGLLFVMVGNVFVLGKFARKQIP
ncbi:MAG: DMT family transporter, partial [Rhizobiaceae bacterium]|nr:DMT family transporter [Rhizobiaceae bacterium]